MVNTIFHLEDVETPPTPEKISHAFEEHDPREKEMERRGSPIEELESINRGIEAHSNKVQALLCYIPDFCKAVVA